MLRIAKWKGSKGPRVGAEIGLGGESGTFRVLHVEAELIIVVRI